METGRITKRVAPFTMMSNHVITNKNLSTAAKGLYALIAYYVNIPDFELYKSALMRMLPEGKRRFDNMWNELKDEGYLIIHKVNTHEGFVYSYELLDEPEIIKEEPKPELKKNVTKKKKEKEITCIDDIPFDDFPRDTFCNAGEPNAGEPNVGECTSINNNIKNNTILNNNILNNSFLPSEENDGRTDSGLRPLYNEVFKSIETGKCIYEYKDYYDFAYTQVDGKRMEVFVNFTDKKKEVINEWISAMAEIYTNCNEYMYIGSKKYKTSHLKQRLLKLEPLHFSGLLTSFNDCYKDIKNPGAYIKTMLINGVSSSGYSQLHVQRLDLD